MWHGKRRAKQHSTYLSWHFNNYRTFLNLKQMLTFQRDTYLILSKNLIFYWQISKIRTKEQPLVIDEELNLS